MCDKITFITIGARQNLSKLFSVKKYHDIIDICILGKRHYNEKIINQIIKFELLEKLQINKFDDDDINDIANLQSLKFLSIISENQHFYISKDKKNMIINQSSMFSTSICTRVLRENIFNVKNITMILYSVDYAEKLCNELNLGCENIRIIINSHRNENLLNFKPLNLPTTIEKIDIIFTCIISTENQNFELNVKNILKQQLKVPFGCNINVIS